MALFGVGGGFFVLLILSCSKVVSSGLCVLFDAQKLIARCDDETKISPKVIASRYGSVAGIIRSFCFSDVLLDSVLYLWSGFGWPVGIMWILPFRKDLGFIKGIPTQTPSKAFQQHNFCCSSANSNCCYCYPGEGGIITLQCHK